MKFRTTVLCGILLLVAGLLGAVVTTVALVLDRAARREVAEELVRGRQVFEDLQGYRQSLFRAECRVVAEEPRLKAVVDSPDVTPETVLGVAYELRRVLQSELFLITDGAGRLVADAADPSATGFDLSGNPVVKAALAASGPSDGSGIWLHERHAYQVQGCRLTFGTTVVGVLVAGFELDDRVAETVFRQTGDSLIIELDGRPIAASSLLARAAGAGAGDDRTALAMAIAGLPSRALDLGDAGGPAEVTIGGVRYLGLGAPFPGYKGDKAMRYVILRSLDQALLPGRRLAGALYGIAAVALLLSALLSVLLSGRLSRPIDALGAFTRRIAGGDLSEMGPLSGPVELSALGAAMNRMVAELAESRKQEAEKERLRKELEIASRIQTSILPRDIRVPGMEVAARMLPADEVGGDYYDVLPGPEGAWIAIGDVAGHGLTAGLVMMMIQSILAALVLEDPAASPRALLRLLNAVLFDNIRQRLGQDEHVTLTLLHYHEGGRIVFSGAHEEIVIYREREGRCEEVPTPGTWLGVVEDVDRFMVDTELDLHEGDLMVLYSDGVIQAMDAGGEQFGMERMCAELVAAHDRPVEEIRDRVLAAVEAFSAERYDDVTLMILRYRGGGREVSA